MKLRDLAPSLLLIAALFLVPPLILNKPPAHAASPTGQLACLYNLPATSGASVLSSSLTPTVAYPTVKYRITVGLEGTTNAVPQVVVSDGTETFVFELNSNTAQTAAAGGGNLHTYEWGACRTNAGGDTMTYNLQFSATTVIGYLLLEEVRDGT